MCGCSNYIGEVEESEQRFTSYKWLTGKSFGETKVGGLVSNVPLVGGILGGSPVGGGTPQGGGAPQGGETKEGGGSNVMLYAGIGVAVLILIVIVVVVLKNR
jgi:hypothetical protein